jgi:hypothetical protein
METQSRRKGRFWLGFCCGLPIYPLLLPWAVCYMPSVVAWWFEKYFDYLQLVVKITGCSQGTGM